jgi:hypothetical protein
MNSGEAVASSKPIVAGFKRQIQHCGLFSQILAEWRARYLLIFEPIHCLQGRCVFWSPNAPNAAVQSRAMTRFHDPELPVGELAGHSFYRRLPLGAS